jgi:hypothetical protein
MAGRQFNQFTYGLEKAPVVIRATAYGVASGSALVHKKFNAAGTIANADTGGFRGLKSIARPTADGDFIFTFQDNYQRFLMCKAVVTSIDGSTAPVANQMYVVAVDTAASGGATVRIRTYLATIGSLVQPSTNDRWDFEFVFSNSSAL